ncbi:MAG TPA: branched-chain-amino-acid transaminase [Longimicrobiales bacterium]|nr:branched-chain-amino-acid transaminase [Longimicrobiales bacterium]
MKVFIDDQIVDRAEARISVVDHGLLYGDGVFEGMRAHDGVVFAIERHLQRLTIGARALHLELPGGVDGIRDVVLRTLEADGGGDRYIRLLVTRGDGPLGLDPTRCERARVVCIVDTIALFSDEKRAAGLSLITSSFRRPPPDVLDTRIKSLNYLNNVMAKGEAVRQGADDALMLNLRGHVAETSVANLFVVRDGTLMTPPVTDGCLPGITRHTVIECARELGIPFVERTLGRMDLFGADEAFMTGTGAGIVRISKLDGERIGGETVGEATVQLSEAYKSVTTHAARARERRRSAVPA